MHSTTRAVTAALALVFVLAGCGNDTDDPNGDPTGNGVSSEPEPEPQETTTTLSEAELAELAHQERVADVVDARVAAWEAHMDAFSDMPGECHRRSRESGTYVMGSCRSAENDLLPATMTHRYLLGEVNHILLNRHRGYVTYPEWDLDVRSVWFPSDDVAVIETCMWYMAEDRRRDGQILENTDLVTTGYHTQQRTEEMWRTDDQWKLAVSQLHYSRHHRDGKDNDYRVHTRDEIGDALDACPVDDADRASVSEPVGGDFDRLTDAEVVALREDIEADHVTALTTMDSSVIDGRISGLLHAQLTEPYHIRDHYWCPSFPGMFREEAYVLPSFYDDAWSDVYDVHYDNDTWSHNKLGDYEASPLGAHIVIPTPSNYKGDCWKEVAYSRIRIGDPEAWPEIDRTRNVGTTSAVTVEDIAWSDSLPVAYLVTCQVMHVTDTSYGTTDHDGPSDLAVRSTEALRLEDGAWQLVARWNAEHWADASECPDE